MKHCDTCGLRMDDKWTYCPKCGSRQRVEMFRNIFSEISRQIKDMNREMQKMEKSFEVRDISPFFRGPKSSGFSIKIIRSSGNRPKVTVKTFGNIDKERIKKQIEGQLEEGRGIKLSFPNKSNERAKEIPIPVGESKVAEEPKTNIKTQDKRVTVDVELRGVKSLDDIIVTELENSIEVRATTKEKAYFKILTKPSQSRLIKKDFSNGVLHLVFS